MEIKEKNCKLYHYYNEITLSMCHTNLLNYPYLNSCNYF